MRNSTLLALSLGLTLPLSVTAEMLNYSCSYTEASYTAPFHTAPSIRQCPEGKCTYQVMIDGMSGSVNGVSGFSVSTTDQDLTLKRTAKDPVMGGMDTTVLTINKSDMTFESRKTTTPSVTLTTQGQCQ
ncbi:hypothetical protein ACFVYJ_12225 [Pontibacter sp. JAM-7]|uniref:hypothetical protein n=1 Tax=Pontibacter sp. JAM-7 TaxID=3366581 RepID=UPI003AF5A5D5